MTEHAAPARVDWWRVVADLQRKGFTCPAIGDAVGVSRGTVDGWKNKAATPNYDDGERLLRLWCSANCVPLENVPRK